MAIRSFSNRRLILHGLIRGISEVEKEIVLDIKRKLQRLNFFFPSNVWVGGSSSIAESWDVEGKILAIDVPSSTLGASFSSSGTSS